MTNVKEQNTKAKNSRRNRRRKYVVDPSFQWRFAATISATVFLASCIMGSVLYGVLHQQARIRLINPETYTAHVTTVVLFASVIFAALTAGGVAVWCIGATHRICGPLFVIDQGFRELIRGRFPKLRPLRKRDEFNEFYGSFMQTVDSLKANKQEDLDALNDALDNIHAAMNNDGDSQGVALESVARKIQAMRDEAAEALGEEQVSTPCVCAGEYESTRQKPVGVS